MFLLPDYTPVDELSIGDTKMRLVETVKKINIYSYILVYQSNGI